MYRVIWEYKVKTKAIAKFEQMYGPKGEWVKLFSQSRHYQGTELMETKDGDYNFVTIDFWDSEEAYNDFLKAKKKQYEELDKKAEALTKDKKRVWI